MPDFLAQLLSAVSGFELDQFHFLRPWWLGLIPLILLGCLYLSRQLAGRNSWQQLIDASLLPHLLQGKLNRQQHLPLWWLGLSLVIASLAMAGPSWDKLPQPVHKNENALVLLLDLSPSMLAQDLQPSRLVRAQLKLTDLLQQRKEGLTALVAYAGEAHTVTPLTDDTETIISLLPALTPDVMPVRGSNTEMALELAINLFRDAGVLEGDILLLTDGVEMDAIDYLANNLPAGYRMSVLGIGTTEGAPIPVRNGGFAKDDQGAIVLAKLQPDLLASLAQRCRGSYRTLSPTDSDITALLKQPSGLRQSTRELQREFDIWQDRGVWLCLLLLPALLLAFRRGWLVCVPLLLCFPDHSQAFGWNDLWNRKDQQAEQLMQDQQYGAAAELFKRPEWKGSAAYRAGDYQRAAEEFAGLDDAQAAYNRGNALARAGQLEQALDAYAAALDKNPDLEDARANRELVESLLQQQEQQQQDQDQQQDQQQQDQQQDQQNSQQEQQSGDSSQQQGDQSPDSQSSPSSGEDDSTAQEDRENSQESDSSDDPSQDSQDSQAARSDPHEKTENQEAAATEEQESQPNDPAQEQSDQVAESGKSQGNAGAIQEGDLSPEEQQAMEQWLRKIPDDPGGLMRRKFKYQNRQRMKEYQQGSWQPPANNAGGRW